MSEESKPIFFGLRASFTGYKLGAVLFQLYSKTVSQELWQFALPGFPEASLTDFCKLFDSPYTVCATDPETNTWIGFGTIFDAHGVSPNRRASASYCFFREFHGSPVIRECARQAISTWFEVAGISVLYGAALKTNMLARNFARHSGFLETDVLPQFFTNYSGGTGDAVMQYLTKERFLEITRQEGLKTQGVVV